jgi:DNA-binding transcriptional regulator YiaG
MLRSMIDEPTTIPGPELAAKRKAYGVTREQLRRQLGLHRNTLRAWETTHELDVIRQRRYLEALRTIVEAAA